MVQNAPYLCFAKRVLDTECTVTKRVKQLTEERVEGFTWNSSELNKIICEAIDFAEDKGII